MQTYSDFQKKAELGGAGEYFQRREEELAKSEMEGYRDGTAVKYPGSWTQTPGTDYWNLDESKVPSGYHQAFWQKMDSINRKYNGNLYRPYRQKENDPTGQGVATGSMGYKMLAQEPEPIMLPPLTVTAHDYTAEMNKDWDEHMNRIKNSGPMDNIPSTQDYMTSRWGKDWMTNPYPQQSGTTQGPTVPMVKNQSYKEFCKKALFEDTIGPTDSILSLHTDSIFDVPRHTDSILEPKLDTTLNLGNACRPGGCTTAPDTGWVGRNPELAAGIGTLLLGGGGVLLYKLMQNAKKQEKATGVSNMTKTQSYKEMRQTLIKQAAIQPVAYGATSPNAPKSQQALATQAYPNAPVARQQTVGPINFQPAQDYWKWRSMHDQGAANAQGNFGVQRQKAEQEWQRQKTNSDMAQQMTQWDTGYKASPGKQEYDQQQAQGLDDSWTRQIRGDIDSWYQNPNMNGFDMSDADLMAADQYGYQTYGNRWVPFHRELYNRNEQMRSAEQANMAEWHKALSSFVQQNKGQQPTAEQRAQLMAEFNKIHGNQAAERAVVYANVMATRDKMRNGATMGDLQAGKFPVSKPETTSPAATTTTAPATTGTTGSESTGAQGGTGGDQTPGDPAWYSGLYNWMQQNPNMSAGMGALLSGALMYGLGAGNGRRRNHALGLILALLGGGATWYGMQNWLSPQVAQTDNSAAAGQTTT